MAGWSDLEVVQRWCAVYPSQYLRNGTPVPVSEREIQDYARDAAWVAEWRRRLGQLGRFIRR